MNRLPIASTVICALAAGLAHAQQEAWTHAGQLRQEAFGGAIVAMPDQDCDGVPELLVSAPSTIRDRELHQLRLLSGADLSLIWEIEGSALYEYEYYSRLAAISDFDGDSVADFVAGNKHLRKVTLHSGADGHELATLAARGPAFGANLIALGDVDGDGDPEVAVSSPDEYRYGEPRGVVRVISCRTDIVLYVLVGSSWHAQFGLYGMATCGDINGDRALDFVVFDKLPSGYQLARVFSGADGAELLSIPFDHDDYLEYWIEGVSGIGDQDQDGTPDFSITCFEGAFGPSWAIVFSGANGSELFRIEGGTNADTAIVGPAGDHDGDGVPEICFGSDTNIGDWTPVESYVRLHRGGDGTLLHELTFDERQLDSYAEGYSFVAQHDFNGDSVPDVVTGSPSRKRGAFNAGIVETYDWSQVTPFLSRLGNVTHVAMSGPAALVGDLDGDGAGDALIVDGDGPDPTEDSVRVLSGRGGTIIAEHSMDALADGAVIGLPDLDGDGKDDFAIGLETESANARVELRSTSSGTVLRTIAAGAAGTGFGSALALGAHSGAGGVQFGIGAPRSSAGAAFGGEFSVYDAVSGALVFRHTGVNADSHLGSAIAHVGDMDGDGVGDWAVGAPRHDGTKSEIGRVAILSGIDGTQIAELLGTVASGRFGSQVSALGDQDGDGIGDLLISSIEDDPAPFGLVQIFAGGGYEKLREFNGWILDWFGNSLRGLPDVNGDGIADWATTGSSPYRVEVRSGGTGGRLVTFNYDWLELWSAIHLAEPPPIQVPSSNGDEFPDLLAVSGLNIWAADAGNARLYYLSALMLGIDPDHAGRNFTVRATVGGGPTDNPVLLERVAVDGVPDGAVLDVGDFDSLGEWFVQGKVPSGMAGITWTLRAYAIDWNGAIASSDDQLLTFE